LIAAEFNTDRGGDGCGKYGGNHAAKFFEEILQD
jgi:hypothetical protein